MDRLADRVDAALGDGATCRRSGGASRGSRSRSGRSSGTPCSRNGKVVVGIGALRRRREHARRRPRAAPPPAAAATGRDPSCASRGIRARGRPRSRAGPSRARRRTPARRPCCRAGRLLEVAVGDAARAVSSPSKKTNWTVWRGRLIVRASCATTAVPEAPSFAPTKPGMVLRVVVRAHHHVAGLAPAHGADHVAEPARAPAGSGRAGRSASGAAASRRDSAEPAGRGPISTWRRSRRNAAAPSKRSTSHGRRPRGAAVGVAVAREGQVVGRHEGHQGRCRAPTCTASTIPSSFTDPIVPGRLRSWRSRDTRTA